MVVTALLLALDDAGAAEVASHEAIANQGYGYGAGGQGYNDQGPQAQAGYGYGGYGEQATGAATQVGQHHHPMPDGLSQHNPESHRISGSAHSGCIDPTFSAVPRAVSVPVRWACSYAGVVPCRRSALS